MTDTERLDFLDRMLNSEGGNKQHFNIIGRHLFTVQTQHQEVDSIRGAIDMMEEFESGRRCWKCENWNHSNGIGCREHRENKL